MKLRSLLILVLAVSSVAFAQDGIKEHYLGKSVQLVQPVPKSIPLIVFDRDGSKFDAALLKLKFERAGTGLEAGLYAVITEVRIDGNQVLFKLVGTGEYPAPPGLPVEAIDEEIWGWGAGVVGIELRTPPARLEQPISYINRLLSHVVTTRNLLSSEGLPEHFQQAIAKGEIIRGMNQRAVFLVMGAPDEVLRELEGEIISEAWLYREDDLSTVAVLFRDGVAYLIKEY